MGLQRPDWSVHWSEFDAQGNERSPTDEMIEFLATQPPAVWHHFVTNYLNYDSSDSIARWIVSQERCARATAAHLFWSSEPVLYFSWKQSPEEHPSGAYCDSELIETVWRNWKADFYSGSAVREELVDASFQIDEWHAAAENAEIASLPEIPTGIMGPFEGEKPYWPAEHDPYNNREMWALIYALDVSVPNVEFDAWQDKQEVARSKWKRERKEAGFWTRLFWDPNATIPFGPTFETEEELDRYIAGDEKISKLVFKRARKEARKQTWK